MNAGTGLTDEIARFVAAPLPAAPPRASVVTDCLVDTLGSALAGADHPAVQAVEELALDDPAGAPVWHSGRRVRGGDAALVNATAAHALDYDDVLDRMIGHPSAVVLPALLVAAHRADAEFGDVAEAFDCAVQVAAALAAGLGVGEHYAAGYHSSSTVGVVAAAAGAARLTGLPRAQVRHALGIAASAAGGLRQNFGSDTKALHLGTAAADALRAVDLARAGASADPRSLEGPAGYLAVLGGAPDPEAASDVLAGCSVLVRDGLNRKRFPCCYEVQRAAEAALALSPRVATDRVETIRLTLHPGATRPLRHPEARTGQDARFSAPYVVSAALLDGRLALDSFTDDAVHRPAVRRLMHRVEVREAEAPPVGPPGWTEGFAVLTLTTSDGNDHTVRVDAPVGHASRPLDRPALAEKFDACARHAGRDDAEELFDLLLRTGEEGGLRRLSEGLGAARPLPQR